MWKGKTYHFRNKWSQEPPKEISGFPRELSRHVVNGAHQDTIPGEPERLEVLMAMVGVVEAERGLNGGAVCDELDGATGVGCDVWYGQEAVGEGGAARLVWGGQVDGSQEGLGVHVGQESGVTHIPEDAVDDAWCPGANLIVNMEESQGEWVTYTLRENRFN